MERGLKDERVILNLNRDMPIKALRSKFVGPIVVRLPDKRNMEVVIQHHWTTRGGGEGTKIRDS